MLESKEYKIFEIPSIKKRVFMDTDYNYLFKYWEKEFEETGI